MMTRGQSQLDQTGTDSGPEASARPLHVQLWSYNYDPEPTGIGPVSKVLAEGLRSRGHHIEVVAAHPHYPVPRWGKRKLPYPRAAPCCGQRPGAPPAVAAVAARHSPRRRRRYGHRRVGLRSPKRRRDLGAQAGSLALEVPRVILAGVDLGPAPSRYSRARGAGSRPPGGVERSARRIVHQLELRLGSVPSAASSQPSSQHSGHRPTSPIACQLILTRSSSRSAGHVRRQLAHRPGSLVTPPFSASAASTLSCPLGASPQSALRPPGAQFPLGRRRRWRLRSSDALSTSVRSWGERPRVAAAP